MPLTDDLAAIPAAPHSRNICAVGQLLKNLPKPEAQALTDALTRGAPAAQIHLTLTTHGHTIGYSSIQRHRNNLLGKPNACRCQSPA